MRISDWSSDVCSSDLVLSVETLTGVARNVLRPDLYADPQPSGDDAAAAGARDEIDLARAQEYALLAALLLRPPDAATLTRLPRLRSDARREGKRVSVRVSLGGRRYTKKKQKPH